MKNLNYIYICIFCFVIQNKAFGSSLLVFESEDSLTVLDSNNYDLNLMDSLYSAVNTDSNKVKIAFPFIWVRDLNANGKTEFVEFQFVKKTYLEADTLQIAVNYEVQPKSDITIGLSLFDITNGELVYYADKKGVFDQSTNELAYFTIIPEIDTIPPDSLNFIPHGSYYYQIVMIDNKTNLAFDSYYDEIIFLEREWPIPPIIYPAIGSLYPDNKKIVDLLCSPKARNRHQLPLKLKKTLGKVKGKIESKISKFKL